MAPTFAPINPDDDDLIPPEPVRIVLVDLGVAEDALVRGALIAVPDIRLLDVKTVADAVALARAETVDAVILGTSVPASGYPLLTTIDDRWRPALILLVDGHNTDAATTFLTMGGQLSLSVATPGDLAGAQITALIARQRYITHLAAQNIRLEHLAREAQSASNAKSAFLANMSHELRTPLNGVLGTAELLNQTDLTAMQRKFTGIICNSGELLLSIISDILDLAKIEAGKTQITPTPFELDLFLRTLIEGHMAQARKKNIALTLDIARDLPNHMITDPVLLRQILSNLLSNAIKFTNHGGVTLSASLLRENRMEFRVSDTGIGIPAAYIDSIFDLFTQADPSTTRKYGGTGLGLAITRQLCSMLDGIVAVSSIEKKGSTFRIEIPFTTRDNKTTRALPPHPSNSTEATDGASILLVEDDTVNSFIAEQMLEKLGHRITLAQNGQIALDLTAGQKFDLILMDCMMPVMDGYTATKAIRNSGNENAKTPIIAVTASALSTDRDRCLAAGMTDYLSKPFKQADLNDIINRHLPPVR